MTRTTGRWLVLAILGAAVVALAVQNSFSNRRLIEGLASGDPASFEHFAERQDAFIFLQSESVETRKQVTAKLGEWQSAKGAKLAITLVPDPDPQVRKNLTLALTKIARRHPDAVAAEFSTGGAAESAALIESAAADSAVGLKVLTRAIQIDPNSPTVYLLAKRIGRPSKDLLIGLLAKGDEPTALSASDALVSFDLPENERAKVASLVLRRYKEADSHEFKRKLFPALALLHPSEAGSIFEGVALDKLAPTDLRLAATIALRRQGSPTVEILKQDADTAVAAAANGP